MRLLRGHNIGDVSYPLGHFSIAMTYNFYGHWRPGHFKSEADELESVTNGNLKVRNMKTVEPGESSY